MGSFLHSHFSSFCFFDSFLGRVVNVAGLAYHRVHAGDLISFFLGVGETHFETILRETPTK